MTGDVISFPKKTGVSASFLKYLACLFMVIDHADALFLLMSYVADPDSLLYYALRILGRISFPLFAFLLAESCRHTRNFPRYLGRLALFAAVSQLPYMLAFGQWGGNVILTFFLAASAVFLYEKALERWNSIPLALVAPFLAATLAEILQCDYGWLAVAVIFALYLCRNKRRYQLICLAIFIFCLYALPALLSILLLAAQPANIPVTVADLTFQIAFSGLCSLSASLALIPIGLYNGQRGSGSKWFFYLFYPAHLLIFYLIARCIT